MSRFLLAVLFLFLATAAEAGEPLIVISIDGFRADYLERGQTPTLMQLARAGVHATAMHPSFPTLTFPNHYTLVTGLRPDHHGVVDNVMWDPAIGPDKFTMSARTADDPRWWEQATPLWVSAAEQGRVTAAVGWPGAEKNIHGRRATYLDPWRKDRAAEETMAVALNWLDLPPNLRPSLEFLYVAEVDHDGHDFGPDSPQLNAALRRVDTALAKLIAGLKARHLFSHTNIVLVSDHGMTGTPADQYSVIDRLVPPSEGVVRTWGSSAGIDALPGHEAAVAAILLAPHPQFNCWRKKDVPAPLHYGGNPRVPQFVCLNAPGWRFLPEGELAKNRDPGNHGFDPYEPDMQALFIAHGPAFRKAVTLAPFDNVDVYPLLARITGLKPQANDGSIATFAAALKAPER